MPQPHANGEADGPLDDSTFLAGANRMCQTMGAFVFAQLFGRPDLLERAGDVLVYQQGHFVSIAALYERCAGHGWNSTIYEAWAYVTRQNVIKTARTLGPIASDALLVCAQDIMEADREEAIEAIGDAQEALYGYRTTVWL